MTKEKLEKEAEKWLNKWELCNKCKHKAECIEEHSYCHLVVNRAYLAGAEPREKRIAELEKDKQYFSDSLDKQIEATLKLQQENSELKEKLKPENCLKLLAKEGYIKFTSEHLTKAKEIIRDLLCLLEDYKEQIVFDEDMQKIKKAEEFLGL